MSSEKTIRMIALYGKGGIGKSTISCNISAALSQIGEKVMQVGCDPKRDSISMLCGGELKPTLLHEIDKREGIVSKELLKEVVHVGYNGILCIESGGPSPGRGCAGRGVNFALNLLEDYKIFTDYEVSFIIFDVLGDVVCGGFAQPMRSGFAREIYLVACGELLTLYQMNNIAMAAERISKMGVECRIAAIIANQRGIPNEDKIVEEVAEIMGIPVMEHIPRSDTVQAAELKGKTVIEAYPDSELAGIYRLLAKKILENENTYLPKRFVTLKEIKAIIRKYTC